VTLVNTSPEEQPVHAFDSTQADADGSADDPLGMDFDDFLPDTPEGITEFKSLQKGYHPNTLGARGSIGRSLQFQI
jgi:hypothetical protein